MLLTDTVIQKMQLLLAPLHPEYLDITDDSAQHIGHAGAANGGGHYRLHLISTEFSGKSSLTRHRLIFSALDSMMHKQIHALSIRASTPEEL